MLKMVFCINIEKALTVATERIRLSVYGGTVVDSSIGNEAAPQCQTGPKRQATAYTTDLPSSPGDFQDLTSQKFGPCFQAVLGQMQGMTQTNVPWLVPESVGWEGSRKWAVNSGISRRARPFFVWELSLREYSSRNHSPELLHGRISSH